MTTLKERAFLNSLKIMSKPFVGDTRRKRIFDRNRTKSRYLIERGPELEEDLGLDYDNNEIVSPNLNENNVKLGDIIIAKQGFGLREMLMLCPEERELMHKYGLNVNEIMQYRSVANNILLDGDKEIFRLLDIPVDNLSKCPDCYKRILYYIAEMCINEREIRADFFKAVS